LHSSKNIAKVLEYTSAKKKKKIREKVREKVTVIVKANSHISH
jgi:hypothetical protein